MTQWEGDEVFCGGLFEKSPLRPPKTPQTKGIATHGRKCEQRASFFCAEKGSFRSPFVRCRFWFVPRSLVDFFEASPYGVLANGGGGVKMQGTRRLRDVREHFAAPTPVGAGGGRGALLAVSRRRNNLGVSLLLTFLFAPAVSKRKVALEAETERDSAQPV